MSPKTRPPISFFFALKTLMAIRFKALGWRNVPAILTSLARGLIRVFGVMAMHYLFDAVAEAVRNQGYGITSVVRGFLFMGGVMITEIVLNNYSEYLTSTHDVLFNIATMEKMNKAAANADPLAYEDSNHLTDIEKALAAIGWNTSSFTWGFIELFTFYLPFLIFMSVYLYNLRPLLLLLFAIIIVPLTIDQIIRVRIMAKTENLSAPMRRTFEHYEKTLTAREYLKETRQLGALGFFFNLYKQTFRNLRKIEWKARSKVKISDLIFRFPIIFAHIGIILLLAFSLRDGFITVGAFAAILASIEWLFDFVYSLTSWGYFANLGENLAASRNIVGFLNLPKRTGTETLPPGTHGVSLQNASFTYPGRSEKAIDNVSLTIAPGETIALVGENGAGKSTLVKLLTGLYLPMEGSAKIGGIETADITTESLYAGMSGVFQRHQKYKLTARDNITISDLESGENQLVRNPDQPVGNSDRLHAAAWQAGAEITGESYPQGPDTMLSREFDGVDLSGGQWQRLAIARGLYRPHSFIVLDEPTAAIDPIEERHIYHSFMELAKGKTAILVTHRLGATRIADRIVVMDGGRIVEEGRHEELMELDGVYAGLFNAQAQWYE